MESTINPEYKETMKQEGESYRVVGFWVRFWAFLIDLAVIGMSSRVLFGGLAANYETVQSFIMINTLFVGIWGAAYLVIMTALWGQTLGKMIFGIRVVQENGAPITWQTAIMRELIGRIISQLLGTNLGYLVCAFHPQKRAVHDIISDTYVVYIEEERPGKRVRIPGLAA